MTTALNTPGKRKYGQLILAILLLLLAVCALYVGSNNFPIRCIGLLAILLSVQCARNYSASKSKI
jgi:hypothetical protein